MTDIRSPRKALFVTTVGLTIDNFLVPHAHELRRRGWIVDAAFGGRKALRVSSAAAFDRTFRLSLERSPWLLHQLWRAVGEIRRIVRDGAYDVVHVHTPIAAAVCRWALRMRDPKTRPHLIYTAHGFHFAKGLNPLANALYRLVERHAARWTTRLIVYNAADEAAAKAWSTIRQSDVMRLWGIGVDLRRFARPDDVELYRYRLRSSLGIPPTAPVIVAVGELNPGKRHADLVEALSDAFLADCHLVIAGEGPERRRLLHLAGRRGVDRRLHLLGFRQDIPHLLWAADAFAMPSAREGLPVSVMEAMAAGLPVVGAQVRGTEDLLDDGRGWLVTPGSTAGIAEAIREILGGGPEVRGRSARAKEFVKRCELNEATAKTAELYEKLVTGDTL